MMFSVPKVSRPILVSVPRRGVFFAESIHDVRFEMGWRRDAFHKCIYILQGTTLREDRIFSRQVLLREGSLTMIPAEVEHRLADREPCILLLLCLARDFVEADEDLRDLWQSLAHPCDRVFRLGDWWRRRMEDCWRRAIVEQAAAHPARNVALKAIAAQVLVQLSRVRGDKGNGDVEQRVAFVTREIEESFFDAWDLDRAAQCAKMSRRAFSAHFHAYTGQTFLARLRELRLRHAARLLLQEHHSVVGAAFSSGYGDLSHFYRLFRQRYHMTPRVWAESGSLDRV